MKILFNRIVAVFFVAYFLAAALAAAEVEGKITSPANGGDVSAVYEVSGTVAGLEKSQELWVVVRKGKNFWPKDKAFVVGGAEWSATVDESATKSGRPYSLVLLAVGFKGQAEIADWYARGDETDWWPALGEIKESVALDQVDVRRK
ncbi:MAG: hypothetical protein K0U98_03675 [Deltaproteobacteria bacterium]|nr:hypothetical protein [Deltaproteobacteria bacterium]